MQSFRDCEGREWAVTVNVAAVKRVRQLLDVDLLDLSEGDTIAKMASDPVLLCDTLYCVCMPQATERGVTDEQFGAALGGDALDSATTAFLDALVDFFPPARRGVMKKVLDKFRALDRRAQEMISARIDSPEIERKMEAEIDRLISGAPSTGSLA